MAIPAESPLSHLVFVDGEWNELAQEMADYLKISDEVRPLLADKIEPRSPEMEEPLAKLVRASPAILSVPEKEFTTSSNLLTYLVLQSAEPKKHLPALCNTYSKPITTSPVNGVGLNMGALTTVFNLLPPADPIRFNVLMALLRFLKQQAMFENIQPYLNLLPDWFKLWNTPEEAQRQMYEVIADVAAEAGKVDESYNYILKALRIFDADDREEISSEEAQQLSLKAVRMALESPTHYLFQDLRGIPSVAALSDSHPVYSQLLDIFAEQDLDDYIDFNDEHEDFVENEGLDAEQLHRKMRLLTFTSLAASTPSRELEYKHIAKALNIPVEEVERWAIDVIRAGLCEGKLSQQRKMFLVHKVTYRVFGEKQWQELSTRVDMWRTTLRNVRDVLRQEQASAVAQKEREIQDLERKMANTQTGEKGQSHGGRRGNREGGGGAGPSEE